MENMSFEFDFLQVPANTPSNLSKTTQVIVMDALGWFCSPELYLAI